jgi:hypothetical protein
MDFYITGSFFFFTIAEGIIAEMNHHSLSASSYNQKLISLRRKPHLVTKAFTAQPNATPSFPHPRGI